MRLSRIHEVLGSIPRTNTNTLELGAGVCVDLM